jgi:hypothetical protein
MNWYAEVPVPQIIYGPIVRILVLWVGEIYIVFAYFLWVVLQAGLDEQKFSTQTHTTKFCTNSTNTNERRSSNPVCKFKNLHAIQN